MSLKLFIFHDDIEELLVAAVDKEDAFTVVDEAYGDGVADDLIGSRLDEYPPDTVVTVGGRTAAEVAAGGRRIVDHRHAGTTNTSRMVKPPKESPCGACPTAGRSTASPTSSAPTTGAPPTGASG